jgi:hypothetical protein
MSTRLVLVATLLLGCGGRPIGTPSPGVDSAVAVADAGFCAPCTDPHQCCPPEKMVCDTDVEIGGGVLCVCLGLWSCSADDRCHQDTPKPEMDGAWSCTWNEFKYVCKRPGSKNIPPGSDGGIDWYCDWDGNTSIWACAATPPNPANSPECTALWKCKVEGTILSCVRAD